MCTAINYVTRDHYFGRNLDLEMSYGEKITIDDISMTELHSLNGDYYYQWLTNEGTALEEY